MQPDWQVVKELVADALERPAAEREDWLVRACEGQPEVLAEARALLRASTDAESFLEGAAEDLFDTVDLAERGAVERLRPGTRLGDYEILDLLGEGGFSEVYRARELGGLDREVALKRLKPGMDTRALLRRFEVEHRTLARLAHPHIARVLDAGAGDDGRPFVVMDLVRGVPLTEFVRREDCDLEQRLELFQQVCDAVEHAHRRGVIHRDLKPSNVMVESGDGGTPRVQVIDFGIARLLDADEADGPSLTAEGMFLGTPAYASPEQLEGLTHDLDTRVDVYALGVILYELLTGRRPSDRADGRPLAVAALLDHLRSHAPTRPSAVGVTSSDTTIRPRELRGELDWITLRALEVDRERRYPSVGALAEDLRKSQRGEPVEAGPPSLTYRLSRLARRHRAVFAGAALALIAMLVGGAAAVVGFVQAREAQRDAEEQAAAADEARREAVDLARREADAREDAEAALQEAGAVGDFLADLLTRARPMDRGRDVTVLELLDEADDAFTSDAAVTDFPAVEARLRNVVGKSQFELGDFEPSSTNLVRAEELARREFGAHDARRLDALMNLAQLRHQQTRNEEADRLAEECAEAARGHLPDDDPLFDRIAEFQARALFERGDVVGARRATEELLARYTAEGEVVSQVAAASNLAQICMKAGDPDASLRYAEQAWELARNEFGATDVQTISAGQSLGLALIQSDPARAIEVFLPTIAAAEERFGPTHHRTLGVRNYLAFCYQFQGRLGEARAEYESLLVDQERTLGETHRQTLMATHNLGMVQLSSGESEAARATLEKALQRFTEARGPDHPETLSCLVHLFDARSQVEGPAAVAEEYAAAVRRHDEAYGADHPLARDVRGDWADHLLRLASALDDVQGTPHETVLKTLQQALDVAEEAGDARVVKKALQWLVEANRAYERPEEAARWQARLDALDPGSGGR